MGKKVQIDERGGLPLSNTDLGDRMIRLESMVAHLEHDLEQMHSVLLAVQSELKSARDQVTKLERRLISASEAEESRSPLEERPPHY